MADKYSTIQQHQPLRVPASFDKQGRALIVQLDEIFDDIYRRFGRLRLEDMGKAFRQQIADDEGNMAEISVAVGEIDARVETAEGDISSLNISVGDIELAVQGLDENKYTIQSGIDIKAAGIEITGGKYIKIMSGSEMEITSQGGLKVKSGATFEVESSNLDIDDSGLVVKSGTIKGTHYDENGNPLLTSADIVVSSTQPTAADGRIWVKPQDTVTAEYRASVSTNTSFWSGSAARNLSFTLGGTAISGQSGNNSYTLELPVYSSSSSGVDAPAVVTVTDGNNSVSFAATLPKGYYDSSGFHSKWVLKLNTIDSDWIATASSLTITVALTNPSQWDCETHGIGIGEIVLKMSSTGSSGSGWKSCDIKVYQG